MTTEMDHQTDSENSNSNSNSNSNNDDRIRQLLRSKEKEFANYTHDANFCIYFKLVKDRKDVDDDIREGTFFPDFVHQFFLDSERIFGYKKPVIRMFYSASRLKRYFSFDYEDKLTKENDGIEADDVHTALRTVLEDLEHTQDRNQFISDVESKEEKDFMPPGDMLQEFEIDYKKPVHMSRAQLELLQQAGEGQANGKAVSNGSTSAKDSNSAAGSSNGNKFAAGSSRSTSSSNGNNGTTTCKKKFQIFHANDETKGFRQFQARMQTLIMWFIESATMIDQEDTHWDFFMVFEKSNPSLNEGPEATTISTEDRYLFAGYATVYRYYAYPDKTRPRISQMLLLPPYRRNGLGTALLQSIYQFYSKQPATLDMTVEDPDEGFIYMRDFLDCQNCLKLPLFQPEKLNEGWSEEMAKEAQEKLKICHRQARKVYEILKLKHIDPEDKDQITNYRLEIKNRLNIPHQKLMLACDKVVKSGNELPEELRSARENQRLAIASLEENYQELVKQYQRTINKLNRSSIHA